MLNVISSFDAVTALFELNKSRPGKKGSGSELPHPELPTVPNPGLAPEMPAISVAIVGAQDTTALADSLAKLIAEADGFACARFDYRAPLGIKERSAAARENALPDVVLAAIDTARASEVAPFFAALREVFSNRPLLITTTQPESFDLLRLLEMGASDFLLPPVRSFELLPRLMRYARAAQRRDPLVQQFKEKLGLAQMIGESRLFLDQVQRIPRFARCDATVLISGESGTGKEVCVRAIHYLSARADKPFVPVNCGALPEHLVESEIFGHKRGAFTGAASDQAGLISEAEGGTLFLDEIDALSPQAQVKLLRFLQDGEYRAVGSQQIAHANIRILAAGNIDLGRLVRDGKFREDLYYRLNVLPLKLPALRERGGDIILLAHHFLEKQAALGSEPAKKLSFAALTRLLSHSWPGNVRELENVLSRAVIFSDGDTIEPADLHLADDEPVVSDQSFRAMKSRAVWRFEHDFLERVLRTHKGNVTRAASAVKKNRRAFWELLRKHGLLDTARIIELGTVLLLSLSQDYLPA